MNFGIVTILAVVGAVFALVELGLTAYLADHTFSSPPSEISFMVFTSIWSLVILAYLILAPMYMSKIYKKIISLALNAISCLFWFAGSIALAVLLRNCNSGYYCGNGKAAIVFGFLLWLIFAALTVMDALDWKKGGATGTGPKGPNPVAGV